MNVKLILKTLGKVLYIQAAYMTFSVAVSLYYMHHGATDESLWPFLIPIAAMLAAAVPLTALKVHNTIFNAREGMVAVALIWVTMSVFGAVPFAIHGGFGTVIDCFFESASGFSTSDWAIYFTSSTMITGLRPSSAGRARCRWAERQRRASTWRARCQP